MAAEFFISFNDASWYASHRKVVELQIMGLPTFVAHQGNEFRLRGSEPEVHEDRWEYDVRLIFMESEKIILEISAHPQSIEADLSFLLTSIRKNTHISVTDEDGEASNW
jgi:hypothetical protein